jgi:aryl-alcohol dehydrogenase-like predicted oxidoreductase
MELRDFGGSGMQVPAVGMGTWKTFDVRGSAAETERHAVARRALDAGINLFDTSPMYGEAQRVLADAITPVRDRVIVADKIWTPSEEEAFKQIRNALRWYDTVDIYQIHNLVAWQQHLPKLEDLHALGRTRVIGVTHYQHSAFRELMDVMQTGRIEMIQIPYNVRDRAVEREILPLAAELNMGVLVMQPLGTGALVRRSPARAELARLEQFGVTTWAQALLKWILSDPRVHCVLPATSSTEHALDNAAAGEGPWLDEDAREYVAALAAK